MVNDKVKNRAAILPYPGDPFLLHYWLENFYKFWADDINKLYIVCNTPVEQKVVEYIEFLCTEGAEGTNTKIDYTFVDHHIQHGDAINMALSKVTEDYVMLVEDDAYQIKAGKINECFELIESGRFDIVGSKRGSCHPEIMIAAQRKYGIAYEGEGDQGPNFWPNFFFTKRQTLEATSRDFNSRAWVQGEHITPLGDYVVEAPVVSSDTFVFASLELRAMIPEDRIWYVNQYHAHPDDYKHFTENKYLFDGRAPWTHIGSLSSGVSGAIMDDQGRSIAKRTREEPHGPTVLPLAWCDLNSDFSKMEWERRVQWWLTFYERRDPNEIPEYAELYKRGLDQLVSQFHLQIKRIRQRQEIYKTLGL